ncbi:hypothetical protein VRK_15920 [Vibrio sp. MEBiC08052]|nr:hypothetical protein VRK_15920 [Vibrio sp. MEBiC08052]
MNADASASLFYIDKAHKDLDVTPLFHGTAFHGKALSESNADMIHPEMNRCQTRCLAPR